MSGCLLVVVGGLGLLAWARTPTGQAALLRLGAVKMYEPVQASLDEAMARLLPGFEPGPAAARISTPDQDDLISYDWPLPRTGPTAAVRCRVVPVPAEQTFWELQGDLAAALADLGGAILWGERLPRSGPVSTSGNQDEATDLLRLDVGVTQHPTHTLLFYKEDSTPPVIHWGAGKIVTSWSHLQSHWTGPVVALVFDDWGYFENEVTRGLLTLDVSYTLAILPGLPFSRRFALVATDLALPSGTENRVNSPTRAVSHDLEGERLTRGCPVIFGLGRSVAQLPTRRREIILHLPMQPEDPKLNPGPGAITVGMSAPDIAACIDGALASLPNLKGVNNHMGSLATADTETMDRVMAVLAERQLYFLDSMTTPRSVAAAAADRAGVAALRNRIFLDQSAPSYDQVQHNLTQLVRAAQANGFAIGIGHPYAETLAVLRQELPKLQRAGVLFVTLSEYMALQRLRQATHQAKRQATHPAKHQTNHQEKDPAKSQVNIQAEDLVKDLANYPANYPAKYPAKEPSPASIRG